MKTGSFTAVLALAFSVTAMAQSPAATPNSQPHDFASRKAAALAKIDQHATALAAARACVVAAQDRADLKTCHAQAKAATHDKQAA